MASIFITGITGFLGANIARVLLDAGHTITATYRPSSSMDLCSDYKAKVKWVLQDEQTWVADVTQLKPSIIIHCAWIGVSYIDRSNWDTQYANVAYLNKLLKIAQQSGGSRIICLGSQAEYGVINEIVKEDHPLNPKDAYGRVKVICSEILKQYCNYYNIDWYWLRLFSFFGKGESDNWLIPSLVKKMYTAGHIDLTAGEQKYAYLYVNDLGFAINLVINSKSNSGVYNICASKALPLRDLIESVRNKINSSFILNFGALPYRDNQCMLMQGDSGKFIQTFGIFDKSDFDSSLLITLDFYSKKFNQKKNESV